MMITDYIREDQLAVRDLLGIIGNSPQQAHEERADGFARLAKLWAIHGNMMSAAVHPLLGATQAWPDPVAATTELQQEVETLAGDLAGREDRHDPSWRGEYERLRDSFERQVQIEQTDLIPLLMELPPDQIAKATETARRARAGG